MIAANIVAVGKLKEKWMREGCAEYQKRIALWKPVQVTEIEEYRLPDNPSPAQIRECIEQEGRRIFAKLPKSGKLVALCIEGKACSSEQMADYFEKWAISGTSAVTFVIGGSYGLADGVKNQADLKLSFSPMTFPHQLVRVMLFEQIYRAMSICANTKYHK